jgi:RNA polymerase sigma factor (TIGR02999 family)
MRCDAVRQPHLANPTSNSEVARRHSIIDGMSDVTRLLDAIGQGDRQASAELLPLVYDELRRLAAEKMAHERPGQTLQATALVHEAYLRLVDVARRPQWDGRGHFFAAAAEAMRRILVENARRKGRLKHGGELNRVELGESDLAATTPDDRLLAIDEALDRLSADDPQAAELVKLRFFAGFSLTEAAEILGMSRTSAYEQWAYARAWLRCQVEDRD